MFVFWWVPGPLEKGIHQPSLCNIPLGEGPGGPMKQDLNSILYTPELGQVAQEPGCFPMEILPFTRFSVLKLSQCPTFVRHICCRRRSIVQWHPASFFCKLPTTNSQPQKRWLRLFSYQAGCLVAGESTTVATTSIFNSFAKNREEQHESYRSSESCSL